MPRELVFTSVYFCNDASKDNEIMGDGDWPNI